MGATLKRRRRILVVSLCANNALIPPEPDLFAFNPAYCRSFIILANDGRSPASKEPFARFGRSIIKNLISIATAPHPLYPK
jgi:hypothetical protein